MRDYKKLQVWVRAHSLTLEIYREVKNFPKEELFGLISQMKRSSSSIPTNIAEGAGRFSNKDFSRFLKIAYGSTNEVEYQIILSTDLDFLDRQKAESLIDKTQELRKMLYALINKLDNPE